MSVAGSESIVLGLDDKPEPAAVVANVTALSSAPAMPTAREGWPLDHDDGSPKYATPTALRRPPRKEIGATARFTEQLYVTASSSEDPGYLEVYALATSVEELEGDFVTSWPSWQDPGGDVDVSPSPSSHRHLL